MRNAVSIPVASTNFLPVGGLGERESKPQPLNATELAEEDIGAYLFDLLVGARRLATSRKQRFLAYLIGMAVEEARLLAMGRSAADAPRKSPSTR